MKCPDCGGEHPPNEMNEDAIIDAAEAVEDLLDEWMDDGMSHSEILLAFALVLANWGGQQDDPAAAVKVFKDMLDEELAVTLEEKKSEAN